MKVYQRNPLLKVICIFFILAHAIIGGRMVSTNNTIMGSIVIAVSLFWIFALINECTPYIKMDDKSLLVYSNFISRPREFVFNKEFQMYYHTRERLVFTYLNPRGIREKARVQLGYMDPEVSTHFVQEFRNKLVGFHPEVKEDKAVIAEAVSTAAIKKSATPSEKKERPVKKTGEKAKTTGTKTAKVNNTKKKKDSPKESIL